MTERTVAKVIINFLVCFTFCISGKAMAATNEYEEPEDSTSANIGIPQDIGLFVLSRIVDSDTGKSIDGVEISSANNKTLSDLNGEFLLKVEPDAYILLKKENYKETSVRVSSLGGKIKLELIPKLLPIFPNLNGSINYRNLGFSEKFNNLSSEGRFNDSFSIDASAKVINRILIGLNYENITGFLNRTGIAEKADLSNQLISLKGAYVFNILKDVLEASVGVKGYWNNIILSNKVFKEDADRSPDYLDFGNQKIGVGVDLDLGVRPIRYAPVVLNAFVSYYPLISVIQPEGGQLPANLNQFDFGVSGRFDFAGAYVQAKYLNKNLFQGNFSSGLSGFSLGIGYGF